jgi:hypothetical protein
VTSYELKNKIEEIRSYIASDWPDINERKKLYQELKKLEEELKEFNEQV